MIRKEIPITTNDSRIYKQILAVINFIGNLTNQEIDVLAEIIMLNHQYEGLPEDSRAKFILSKEMRKEMRDKLNIKQKQFDGLIKRLKEKPIMKGFVLSDIGVVHPGLLLKPDEEGIEIKIILKKDGSVMEPKSVVSTLAAQNIINPVASAGAVKEPEKVNVPVRSTEIPRGRPENYVEIDEDFITIIPPKL